MGFRETDQQQTKGVLRIDSFELWSSNKLTTDALHGIHNAATPPVAVGPGYGNFQQCVEQHHTHVAVMDIEWST
jgi:hypothetical protein